ncbi:MAG: hypothetical protein HQ464_05685 [Planctomycetes bacterium]|nr:hypothetical protein [Planctomycetota bacterium]
MAKKKKKVAKKAAEKKPSGAAAEAEVTSCPDQDLEAAPVVNTAGESAARFGAAFLAAIEARGIDIRELLNTAVTSLQRSETNVPASSASHLQETVECVQAMLMENESAPKPYVRFVGRVAEILLNHRGFQTITAGDLFQVFLVEISAHLKERHRQNSPTDQPPSVSQADVSTGDGRRTFNTRMERLWRYGLLQPTVTRASGRNEDYVLTEVGQSVFDGWPPLSEIPGLELHGPVKPENTPRRRPRRRS